MPNWSSNTLIVSAESDNAEAEVQLAAFVNKINRAENSDQGIFSQFFPCPQELYDNPGNGFDTWYSWHVKHWGTKWDVPFNDISFSDTNDSTNFQMWLDTPWSPPLAFVQAVSELYPLLTFRCAYSEAGMAFAGYNEYEAGSEVNWYKVEEVGYNDTEDGDFTPYEDWGRFMEEYGLHEGG
jgi:Ferredoxin-like domain in Api92-like protein